MSDTIRLLTSALRHHSCATFLQSSLIQCSDERCRTGHLSDETIRRNTDRVNDSNQSSRDYVACVDNTSHLSSLLASGVFGLSNSGPAGLLSDDATIWVWIHSPRDLIGRGCRLALASLSTECVRKLRTPRTALCRHPKRSGGRQSGSLRPIQASVAALRRRSVVSMFDTRFALRSLTPMRNRSAMR